MAQFDVTWIYFLTNSEQRFLLSLTNVSMVLFGSYISGHALKCSHQTATFMAVSSTLLV
jgi:hypothetical protein